MTGWQERYDPFLAGLDLGLKRDHSALVVIGIDTIEGKAVLAQCQSWNPKDYGGTLPVSLVKAACLEAAKTFKLRRIIFDPWQCLQLAQELADEGIPMTQFNFTPARSRSTPLRESASRVPAFADNADRAAFLRS